MLKTAEKKNRSKPLETPGRTDCLNSSSELLYRKKTTSIDAIKLMKLEQSKKNCTDSKKKPSSAWKNALDT
jgi:hypothetical protein